jgi:hypothetical protein
MLLNLPEELPWPDCASGFPCCMVSLDRGMLVGYTLFNRFIIEAVKKNLNSIMP